MQNVFGFSFPHDWCKPCFNTASLSVCWSQEDRSAGINSSFCNGCIREAFAPVERMKMQCASGRPFFWNVITLRYKITSPKCISSITKAIGSRKFPQNTCVQISGGSCAFCPGNRAGVIYCRRGCSSLSEICLDDFTDRISQSRHAYFAAYSDDYQYV